jgi:uncharacterized protein YbjT (DUF2867 family)
MSTLASAALALPPASRRVVRRPDARRLRPRGVSARVRASRDDPDASSSSPETTPTTATRRATLATALALLAAPRAALADDAPAAAPAAAAAAAAVSAAAAPPPRIVVVGATGQTGALVVDALRRRGGAASVVAAVRSAEKARKLGVDRGGVELLPDFDVTADAATLAERLGGGGAAAPDVLIIATGFVPGNPFKMAAAARAVDNEGVVHLVDAAKNAGVRRVVLISSILVDGRAMGAEDSPGFKITNAFGGVLDEKLVGERALEGSGLEWVIVRPAGLRADSPKTPLVATPGNVMASGEVSRALVADVMAEAAFAKDAAGKIVEIAEAGTFAPGYEPENVARYQVGEDRSKWFPTRE